MATISIVYSCHNDDDTQQEPTPLYVIGTESNEAFDGTVKNDTIIGGDGRDIINGFEGDDFIYGGNGDTFTNTGILESNGNDTIDGGEGNDQLVAEQGDDIVIGGGGNDLISGSEGNDHITGGTGNDIFISLLYIDNGQWLSNSLTSGIDVITDFVPGEDSLIFFDRNNGFAQATRDQFDAAFGQPNGFTVDIDSGNLILSWGDDSITLEGDYTTLPATLDELEALIGANAILYGN